MTTVQGFLLYKIRKDQLMAEIYQRLFWAAHFTLRIILTMAFGKRTESVLSKLKVKTLTEFESKILSAFKLKGRVIVLSALGSLYYCRIEDIKSLIWSYEYPLTDFLLSNVKPNHVFLDIGAHIGRYTVLASKIAKQVIALEPEPSNFHILQQSIHVNYRKNVKAIRCVAGEQNDYQELKLTTDTGGHTIKDNIEAKKRIIVPCYSVDNLIKSLRVNRLDWVKIDVEGAEVEVLAGMREILRTLRPRLIVEVHMDNLGEVERILSRSEYEWYRVNTLRASKQYILLGEPA